MLSDRERGDLPVPRDAFGFGLSLIDALLNDRSIFDSTLFSNLSVPNIDISETDTEIAIIVDAPGFKKDEIDINVTNGILTITAESAETKEEGEGEDKRVIHIQERKTEFVRSVDLPRSADTTKVEANLKDGCLHIIIPKKEADPDGGKVEITED